MQLRTLRVFIHDHVIHELYCLQNTTAEFMVAAPYKKHQNDVNK
jgi:hypothetical protein